MDKGEFARYFRRRCAELRMTYGQLAMVLGVSRETVQKWADSFYINLPEEGDIEQIADVIKADPAELKRVWQRSMESQIVKSATRRNLKPNKDCEAFLPGGVRNSPRGFGARSGGSSS